MSEHPTVKVAQILSEIVTLDAALLTQAVSNGDHPDMPGGPAMAALGNVANMEAWENQHQATERYGKAYTSVVDEDPDEAWSAFQLLEFWSEQWRAIHGAEYGKRPTIATEANFIRYLLGWAWDNEPQWSDFAADMKRAKARLEGILVAGDRSERGAPCLYDECGGVRLVRKLVPKPGPDGEKTWVHSDWHCPKCKRTWDEDRYWANVKAANERAQREEIDGEAWTSVEYAARVTDRSPKTIRTWINRGHVATVCIIEGKRIKFVSLDDVIERHERGKRAGKPQPCKMPTESNPGSRRAQRSA